MRYAALLAASAAVVAVFTLPRDGRSEATPARASSAVTQTAPAQARLAGRASTQEDFRWSGRVARGDEIEIRGLVGSIVAEPASGDQVEVVGRRVGDDAEAVRIEVVESDEGVVICTIYPGNRRSERASRDRGDGPCENGMHGDWDMDDLDARIDFTVRVPAGVRFAAATVDGDIRAEGLRSDVNAATVSGNVRVATTGTARAATVSGNVDATFGQADSEGMEFASVSGNVIVRLAGNVGAEVRAHTLSGNIESDFEGVRVRGGGADDDGDDDGGFHVEIGKQARGTVGGGGPELNMNTVSGNIRLLRN
jgi:hypothetical protein